MNKRLKLESLVLVNSVEESFLEENEFEKSSRLGVNVYRYSFKDDYITVFGDDSIDFCVNHDKSINLLLNLIQSGWFVIENWDDRDE